MPLKSTVEGEGWKARPIKLKIFGNLIQEVVNKNLCMYCGACIASCPIDILFHSEKEEPIMRGTCAACQVCYYSCPRIELPVAEIEQQVFGRSRTAEEAILGIHVGAYSVKSKDPDVVKRAQDGGAELHFSSMRLIERSSITLSTRVSPQASLGGPSRRSHGRKRTC
jgi:ferredoxin